VRSRLSRHLPLSGLRLVTTLPPNPWFGGNNFVQARVHTRALRELGAEVYEFDTAAIYANDVDRIARQKREIIEFRPDAAVSTPNAGYIVQGGQRTGRAGPPGSRALNLFIEELELPVVLFWDHGLTQPAHYLLLPTPDHPEQSQGGALSILKRLFVHPNIVHLFPDTGHAEELARLGLASFGADDFYVQGVGHAFMEVGNRGSAGDSFDHEVAFFGNIYLAASGKLPYAAQPEFTQLRRRVSETRSANPRLSFYHAYRDAIAALQPSARSRLRLDPDQSFYWRVMFDELTHYMNGEEWPAPGSEDTELRCLMEQEVCHGEAEVYAGVQA